MKNKYLIFLLLISLVFAISGCSSSSSSTTSSYNTITGNEAKTMMDESSDVIILDVRTEEEFATGHIKGAIVIPDIEITEKAEGILTDKTATILIYCHSGRRAALASADLAELGYTNIYDFGGILDWNYEVVTD
ncbi:MAG: rhodanese-like domain-containing protein [Lachnotalea sp.]